MSHEAFTSIITEKNIYEKIKENIKITIEPPELPSIEELIRENSLERSTKENLTTL